MTPAILAEKELHEKILNCLGNGKTSKEVASIIGESVTVVRDALYLLNRYRRKVYIDAWQQQANDVYLGIYVVGDKQNATRPRSKYSSAEPEDVFPVIMQSLPGSRGDIAEVLGVGLNRIYKLISMMVEKGMIEQYKSPTSSHKVIYILPGTAHLMEDVTERLSNTPPKKKGSVKIDGSIFPEFPWPGYNENRPGTLYPTTWRHQGVQVGTPPN